MNSKGLNIFKKIGLWIAGSVTAIFLLILILLYTPFFQNMAKDIAIEKIEQSMGMDVSIENFRLHFPLDLELKQLAITHHGDTMLAATRAQADVALLPLVLGRIKVNTISLDNALYIQGTPDSALHLKARIDNFMSHDTELSMDIQNISIGENTRLKGADIYLALKETADTLTDTTPSAKSAMTIVAPKLQLSDVNVCMTMRPIIDTLNTHIGTALLTNGLIDMLSQNIMAEEVNVDSLTATYLTPINKKISQATKNTKNSSSAEPWSIRVDKISISAPNAIYAQTGAIAQPGLDLNYIQVCDTKIEIDSFFNRGTEIRIPLKSLTTTERCGLSMNASGMFCMDSTSMSVEDFNITTPSSTFDVQANVGNLDLVAESTLPPLQILANADIALTDIATAYPSLKYLFSGYPDNTSISLIADINNAAETLNINKFNTSITNLLSAQATGAISNPLDFNKVTGHIDIQGTIKNANTIKNKLLDKSVANSIKTPSLSINGHVDYKPHKLLTHLTLEAAKGNIVLDALWHHRSKGYDIALNTENLPLQEIIPSLGINDLTANIELCGQGYDPTKLSTEMVAVVDIHKVNYQGSNLENIILSASIDSCHFAANINSANRIANLNADINAWLNTPEYQWIIDTDINHLDLHALHLNDQPLSGSVNLITQGRYNQLSGNIDANLELNNLAWNINNQQISLNKAIAHLASSDSLTHATISTDDLLAQIDAHCSIDSLVHKIGITTSTITQQLDNRDIDIVALRKALPSINLSIESGQNNVISRYLANVAGFTYHNANIKLSTDTAISLLTDVNTLKIGKTRLDNVAFSAKELNKILAYSLKIDNKPGTMDDFAHIDLSGFLSHNRMAAILKQSNIADKQGFHFGITTSMSDTKLTAQFHPQNPIIAYKKWALNSDNFVEFDFNQKHLDANLTLQSDSSSLRLFTEHSSGDTIAQRQENIILSLKNINLAEWLSISPFAPPVKGDVDADLRFRWNRRWLTGKGSLNVNDLYYGKERVGSFGLALKLATDNRKRALRADASLLIDSVKVMTASGNINDSTAVNPFLLDFNMIHFPLRVANPFLSKNVAQLSGMLNGKMNITGSVSNPIFNGYIDFDSTAVKVGITGMPYSFSEEKIPVDSNVVRFNDFAINGLNRNPLLINGTVDASNISNLAVDLTAKARDMQIVNSSRPKGANIYGKAYIDLDATVKGDMSLLRVDADLNLLGGTDVTYVMTDGVKTLTPQSSTNMVRFVNLSDTTATFIPDKPQASPLSLLLNANLTVSDGTTINVDLSPDGKNKVSISGSGNLSYTQTPMSSDGRITGRYTINNGYVNYTPQISSGGFSMSLMKEKSFKFQEGSYVAFTGDMLNPTLNIRAVDELKVNVTPQGQNSRLINFDIILSVTNTLQNMNVAFDLSTNDNLTIQNELQGMSPEQRANQAMNMLLYNQYTGPSTKSDANIVGNPLYSFLASQLNSWMANNIDGVDISFGIDQYNKTVDGAESTTTSYNYRVSKTLFDNRFKIVVGGNYSTDADADENFSQNLINDISFEYALNRSGSMYVKLFRHVGYESILEGEITQTGVGFVIKRKLNSLRDLFRFGGKSKTTNKPKNEATETK